MTKCRFELLFLGMMSLYYSYSVVFFTAYLSALAP